MHMVQSVLSAQHADWVYFMCWWCSSRTGQAVEEDRKHPAPSGRVSMLLVNWQSDAHLCLNT